MGNEAFCGMPDVAGLSNFSYSRSSCSFFSGCCTGHVSYFSVVSVPLSVGFHCYDFLGKALMPLPVDRSLSSTLRVPDSVLTNLFGSVKLCA